MLELNTFIKILTWFKLVLWLQISFYVKVLKQGLETTGEVPSRATITIHYSLYLEGQDEPYDSSILRGKCERYILDDGQLLPGLEIAIKSMKKKEHSEFLISSAYGFGEFGCPPR